MKINDIILGEKYYLLTPRHIEKQYENNHFRTYAICDCDCGNKNIKIIAFNLGKTKSCGCSYVKARRNKRKIHFKYEIGERVIDENKDLTILARKIEHTKQKKQYIKSYKIKCNKCGFDSNHSSYYVNGKYLNEYWLPERGKFSCPCCCKPTKIIQFGVNSIFDTDKWMVKYFVDKELPKKITSGGTGIKRLVECPYCHERKYKTVAEIHRDHSIGCLCSRGKSFYERCFGNICQQLSEQFGYQFDSEISPDWCIFPDYLTGQQRSGRYDFQPDISLNLYVELDGDFHRENNKLSGQTLLESNYIDKQKDRLADINGFSVIRIICDSKTTFKNNVINNISQYFDLSNVDFKKAFEFAEGKFFQDICNDKNNGLTIKQISEKYHVSMDLIRRRIKLGKKLGKCDYNPENENKKIFSEMGNKYKNNLQPGNNKKPIEISCNKINWEKYESMQELINVSSEKYGHKFVASCISRVCHGTRDSYLGYYFRFAK